MASATAKPGSGLFSVAPASAKAAEDIAKTGSKIRDLFHHFISHFLSFFLIRITNYDVNEDLKAYLKFALKCTYQARKYLSVPLDTIIDAVEYCESLVRNVFPACSKHIEASVHHSTIRELLIGK